MEPISSSEKTILGWCAAAAVLSSLPWYSVSFGNGMEEMSKMFAEAGGNTNAFGTTEGILAFVAILATGGLLLADRAGALPWSKKARLLAPFVSAVAAFVFMLFFMTRGGSMTMMGVSAGRTFWFYLALIAVGVAGFFAYQRWIKGAQAEDAPRADGDGTPGAD